MPGWLLSLLSLFAPQIISWALSLLEKQYPGITPIVELIKKYLSANPKSGAVQMQAHVESLCSGVACPPTLKGN